MRLRLLLPSHVEADREVDRVSAEGVHGQFTVLPRHVDGVMALVAGLLSYVAEDEEVFYAVDGGTLVKHGEVVLVATTGAHLGPGLEDLDLAVPRGLHEALAEEARARGALVRIEHDLIQRFVELEEQGRA